MMLPTKVQVTGGKDLKRFLNDVPKKGAKKALRKAVTAAASPMVKAAKANAPTQSGLLKKSLTKKIKAYSNGNVVAIIGANKETTGEWKGKRRVPAKYIHLVDGGHGGPHAAPANDFLRKAYDDHKAEAGSIIEATLKEVLDEIAQAN